MSRIGIIGLRALTTDLAESHAATAPSLGNLRLLKNRVTHRYIPTLDSILLPTLMARRPPSPSVRSTSD